MKTGSEWVLMPGLEGVLVWCIVNFRSHLQMFPLVSRLPIWTKTSLNQNIHDSVSRSMRLTLQHCVIFSQSALQFREMQRHS